MNLRQITIKDQLELNNIYYHSNQSLDEKFIVKNKKEPGQAKLGITQILISQ